MVTDVLFIAHAGAGATWQALVATIGIGLVVVFLLAAAGRLELESLGDLVLPLAAVAILSSLAPTASDVLSDWVGYAAAAGLVSLAALTFAARPGVSLHWSRPLAIGTAVAAAAAAVWLGPQLNLAWHPRTPTLPLADDAAVAIAAPTDGGTVDGDDVTVSVELDGATAVSGFPSAGRVPDDPEDRGRLRLFLDGREVTADPVEECTEEEPCDNMTYVLGDVGPGPHTLIVEFVRADGVPLAPSVFDRVTFEAR